MEKEIWIQRNNALTTRTKPKECDAAPTTPSPSKPQRARSILVTRMSRWTTFLASKLAMSCTFLTATLKRRKLSSPSAPHVVVVEGLNRNQGLSRLRQQLSTPFQLALRLHFQGHPRSNGSRSAGAAEKRLGNRCTIIMPPSLTFRSSRNQQETKPISTALQPARATPRARQLNSL